MRRVLKTTTLAMLLALVGSVPAAKAEFGLTDLDMAFTTENGAPSMQAGSHPFQQVVTNAVETEESAELGHPIPVADVKNLDVSLPAGMVGKPTAAPRCSVAEFANSKDLEGKPECNDATAVGTARVEFGEPGNADTFPVYNLVPSPGTVAKLGFSVLGRAPVVIDLVVSQDPPYVVVARVQNTPQVVFYYSSTVTVWGVPADERHDEERGMCVYLEGPPTCPVNVKAEPFLTLPTSCEGPMATTFRSDSWQEPGEFFEETIFTHDDSTPPNPLGTYGCSKAGFDPTISADPTSKAASSPTGLDFSLNVEDEGIENPSEEAVADSTIEKTVVTLPEGFSVNPSIAEGLEVCTEAQLDRESAFSEPGAGCPQAAKIGTVEVESPLLEENVNGSLYQAAPYANPFDSLIALYIVIKNPTLGIKVIQPLNVIPDPKTGRLTTVAEDMPQLPFSSFKLRFREGARSPLATPPACGDYTAQATLYPHSGAAPVTTTSAFEILSGPNGAPCPKGGLPPFKPDLVAGTINNAAGRFSPFNVKITRDDSEQEITRFSIKLPPGVAGKLAGIPYCPDAGIAKAKSRTGPNGGQEELNDPSCPAASQVGRTLAGSGVGSALAWAPGKIYLAGPYNGKPVSFVAITAGVVGPFDIGTVVVRLAIDVNPETGEVFLDSVGSDPIPHIIHGVPIHLRDIRAYTDRPEFTFNPTSCERSSTAATVLGSGLDFASLGDDNPFVSTSPFQAADCAALPFQPKLTLRLSGGTKRGQFPKLRAFLRMRGFGEAGVGRAQVTLPRSEFIANAHFETICTRVQFKQQGGNGEACPPGSIYGHARAKSPILAEPLEGPIYLRSSEHELPDVVASLRGQQINVHLVGRVDSVKGRLRNTFETVPDAPVDWASFSFKGGKKGLFENSTNLCVGKHRADIRFTGQNGKRANSRPAVKVKCKGKGKRAARKR